MHILRGKVSRTRSFSAEKELSFAPSVCRGARNLTAAGYSTAFSPLEFDTASRLRYDRFQPEKIVDALREEIAGGWLPHHDKYTLESLV